MGNSYVGEFARLTDFRGNNAAIFPLNKIQMVSNFRPSISSPAFLSFGEKRHAC